MLNQLGTLATAAATTATSLISEYTQATRRAVNHMLQLRESVLLNDWNQVSILLQQQNDENETITDPRDTPTLEQEERMIIQNEALRKVVLFKLTKALLNKAEGPPISESIDLSSYPLDNMRMDLLSTVEIDDGLKEAKKMNSIEGDVKVLVETSSIIRKLRRGLIAIEEAGSNYVDKSHYNPNKNAATTVVSKSSEGAASEWSTVVIVTVIFIS